MRPIFDAHLDLAWNALQWNRDLTQPLDRLRDAESSMRDHPARGRATVSLQELSRAGVRVCLVTILARCKPDVCPPGGFNRRDLDLRTQTQAHAVGQGQLAYYRELERQGKIRILRTTDDLRHLWNQPESPLGVILAMEGADPIVGPEQVGLWFDQGLRCVGMAHYGPAPYAVGTGATGSLTPAGVKLLKEFERVGIIVDLTHCSLPGFQEVLDQYSGPIHASHNMCQALVPGNRQFADWQIEALIERGAVIGMACDAWMIQPDWRRDDPAGTTVTIEAIADHIDHICQLAGNARHVGIGSDLDGGFGTEQTPADLDSIADLQRLEEILSRRGYPENDIDAIFHGNWFRFFLAALPESG